MKTPHRIPLKIVTLSVLMVAFLSACNKEVVPDDHRPTTGVELRITTEEQLAHYNEPVNQAYIAREVDRLVFSGPFRTINGFNNLQKVPRIGIVDSPNLESITGFNNLEATDFTIYGNKSLHTLNIFDDVVKLNGLFIGENSSLQTINGFNNLQNIKEFLAIEANSSLQTINGFNNLRSVNRLIVDNSNLLSVAGFESLETGDIEFYNNTRLTSMPSFESLETGGIAFYNNTRLKRMPRFDALRTGSLAVAGNDSLSSISGFGALVEANTQLRQHPPLRYAGNIPSNARVKTTPPPAPLSVFIASNRLLTSISGFGRLENVDVSLELNKNAALTTVEGFQSLRLTQNQLVITGNPNLVNLPSTLRP